MGIWSWHNAVAWRDWRQNGGIWLMAAIVMSIPLLVRIIAVELLQSVFLAPGHRTVAVEMVREPSYAPLWVGAATVFGVAAFWREWSHQGLPVVLAGPVGRRQVVMTKWGMGWLLLQGVLLLNVLVAVLLGAYEAGWSSCLFWWLSSAIGLSAAYALAFLAGMWTGTPRSAGLTAAFLVFGVHVWIQLMTTLVGRFFADCLPASVMGNLWKWSHYLSISQYMIRSDLFFNPGSRLVLLVATAVFLGLAVANFDRLPLERMGRAWMFRWAEKTAVWVGGITLFMIAGGVGSTVYLILRQIHLGISDLPPVPIRILVFAVAGGAAVCLVWALAKWSVRRRYAQG
ncbi:MAG: hypothetical protein IRY98_01980 [Alicyclobacillaceae bacterium]|nr:hypothetical protein [Alicyclobacillaceae bacterium]